MQKPSIGRIVIYNTTEADRKYMAEQTAAGSHANIQKQLPAIVCAIFDAYQAGDGGECNVKVMMDGLAMDLWKPSIPRGDAEGQWNWPVIVGKDKPATTEGTTGAATNTQG